MILTTHSLKALYVYVTYGILVPCVPEEPENATQSSPSSDFKSGVPHHTSQAKPHILHLHRIYESIRDTRAPASRQAKTAPFKSHHVRNRVTTIYLGMITSISRQCNKHRLDSTLRDMVKYGREAHRSKPALNPETQPRQPASVTSHRQLHNAALYR